jgi:hypothetical protein
VAPRRDAFAAIEGSEDIDAGAAESHRTQVENFYRLAGSNNESDMAIEGVMGCFVAGLFRVHVDVPRLVHEQSIEKLDK